MSIKQGQVSNIKPIAKSGTLLINELSLALNREGRDIIRFGFGQSPFSPPAEVISELQAAAMDHHYMPVQGDLALRERISGFYQDAMSLQFSPGSIYIGPGSKQLIYNFLSLFSKADLILVSPFWVSYEPQGMFLGHRVINIPSSYDNGWALDPADFEKVCREETRSDVQRLLILNYPGNPSGMTYSEAQLKEIAAIARRYNVIVISDEIYGFLTHHEKPDSLYRYYPEGTVVTTGLSKWCGAGGWRLGVAMMSDDLNVLVSDSFLGLASETYSCVSSPVQVAAIEAYRYHSERQAYIAKQNRILALIADYIVGRLKDSGVIVHRPDGGFYLYPCFSNFKDQFQKRGCLTSESICQYILNQAGVALLPGSAFGSDELTARLAYVDFDGRACLSATDAELADSEQFLSDYCPKILSGTAALLNLLAKL